MGVSLVPRYRNALFVLSATLLLSGCTLFEFEDGNRPFYSSAEPVFVHEVRYPGETLGLISEWYAGTPRYWRDILASNEGIDVRRITLGTRIRIPERLVVRRSVLSRTDVQRWQKMNEKSAGATIVAAQSPQVRPAAASPSGEYQYPVRTISGCEELPNSLSGLSECANRVQATIQLRAP